MDGRNKDNVKPGIIVKIIEDRDSKDLIQGVVKEILTSSEFHPYGIKVRLENGQIGRVKEVIGTQIEKINSNLPLDPMQQIKRGESTYTEFKSSFRFDITRYKITGIKDINKEVEKSVSKTIAAFMNSEGGKIFIGVDDQGNILGLENDYEGLEKPLSDKFRLLLKNSIQKYLKNKIVFEYLTISLEQIYGKEICVISTIPTPIPIFLYDNDKQDCYVRVDNESKLYGYREFYEYWQRHSSKLGTNI